MRPGSPGCSGSRLPGGAGAAAARCSYQERYDQLHSALYRWDIWAAAYLIGGGCSDDGFTDFRAGLIAQGRDWYEKVAACPDSLADHPVVAGSVNRGRNPLEYEEVGYAASYAFQRVTGDEHGINDAWFSGHAPGDYGDRSQDMGEEFDFDDAREMRRRLPRLATCRCSPRPRRVAGYMRGAATLEYDGQRGFRFRSEIGVMLDAAMGRIHLRCSKRTAPQH